MRNWLIHLLLAVLFAVGCEMPVCTAAAAQTEPLLEEAAEDSSAGSTGTGEAGDPQHSDGKAPVITWKLAEKEISGEETIYLGLDMASLTMDIAEMREEDLGIGHWLVTLEDANGAVVSKSMDYDKDGHREESISFDAKDLEPLKDGEILCRFTAEDRVGNEVSGECRFVKDTRAPSIAILCNDPAGMQSMQGETAFFSGDIEMNAFIRDENPKPDTYTAALLYSEDGRPDTYREVTSDNLWIEEEGGSCSRSTTIYAGRDPDGYYKLIVSGMDLAGNQSVIEGPVRVLETVTPSVKIVPVTEAAARAGDGRKLFAGSVQFAVDVSELYENSAGIYQITYDLLRDGEYLFRDRTLYKWINSADGKEYDPVLYKPTVLRTENITIPANSETQSNALEIVVHASDRAGNKSKAAPESSYKFGIDTEGPEIYVDVTNDDVRNGRYFQSGRTAVVREYERNPSGSTAISAQGASISSSRTVNTSRGSAVETVVSFEKDGDYRLEVTGADALGNQAKVTYSGVTPRDFCIDTTAPQIEVRYDNNDVRNEYFYNKPRLASIRIAEVNLEASGVKLAVRGEAHGGALTRQTEYSNMQVYFGRDGSYQIFLRCEDLAGNRSDVYRGEKFVIDTLPPVIQRVRDRQTPSEAVLGESIQILDAHLLDTGTKVASCNRTTGSREEIFVQADSTEGQKSVFAGRVIPCSRRFDGMYQVTAMAEDLAGNQAKEQYTCSVDRFGPDYSIAEGTVLFEAMQEGYYPGGVLTVTEKSVSEMTDRSVYLYSGREGRQLTEGEDYETYSIREDGVRLTGIAFREELFAQDGEYQLALGTRSRGIIHTMSFYTDRTAPTAVLTGIDPAQHNFAGDRIRFFLVPRDNHKLQEVELCLSTESGEVLQKTALTGEELAVCLEQNGGKIPLEAYENEERQFLEAAVVDEAGNRNELMSRADQTAYVFAVGKEPQVYYLQILVLLGAALSAAYIIGFTKTL